MEICKLLTLSTAHIAPKDDALLAQEGENELTCVVSYPIAFGHLVWIPIDDRGMLDYMINAGLREGRYSTGMIACFELARETGCRYIRFDADAPLTDRLEDFSDLWGDLE